MRLSGRMLVFLPTGLLGAIVSVIGFFAVQRLGEVNDRVAELERANLPTSIRDLTRQAADPNNDATPLLLSCTKKLKQLHLALRNDPQLASVAFARGPEPPVVTDEVVSLFEGVSDRFQEALMELGVASDCHEMSILFEGNNGKLRTDDFRQIDFIAISQVLLAQGRIESRSGRSRNSLQAATQLLKLAGLIDTQHVPTGLRFLSVCELRSSAAILIQEVLATNELTAEERRQLDVALESNSDLSGLIRGIEADRAWVIEMLNTMPVQRVAINGLPCLNYFEHRIDCFSGGFVRQGMPKPRSMLLDGDLLVALAPSWETVLRIECQVVNQLRALRIASALQLDSDLEFTAQIDADYLAELGVPREAAQDVVTGGTMKVERSGDVWNVHSTGNNAISIRR